MGVIHQQLVDNVIQLTLHASEAILAVYNDEKAFTVDIKSDQSPVTAADIAAHHVLVSGLKNLLPDTPVLSEESSIPSFDERQRWTRYWLIDPLDGTKEFIRRNNEFTVNVALIEAGKPILGVVTIPVTRQTYWGAENLGAFKVDGATIHPLSTRTVHSQVGQQLPIEIVASRRHGSEAMAALKETLDQHFTHINYKNMGSSLKLCLIAEGKADLYPRLALTSEWDTAAAQAVVEAAGGSVVDLGFNVLRYNTKASLLNPFFHVIGDVGHPWESLLAPCQEMLKNDA